MAEAEKARINPANKDYNLPAQLKGFVQISKIKNIDKNIGFYRFIKALIKEQSPSITTLKNWLELFNQNNLSSVKESIK